MATDNSKLIRYLMEQTGMSRSMVKSQLKAIRRKSAGDPVNFEMGKEFVQTVSFRCKVCQGESFHKHTPEHCPFCGARTGDASHHLPGLG